MSDNVKARKKELELREQAANTEKAEIELENARLRLKVNLADFEETHTHSPDESGVFHFVSDVSDASCYNFGKRVSLFASRHPGAPITVVLNTPGGSVLPGLGLYDDLRTLSEQGHHITTKVRGYAASFGAILLQAGDTRLVGTESHLMIHEISSLSIGKLHEQENELEFTKKLNLRLFTIMASRTGGKWTGAKLYAKAKAKDLWLSSSEAVEWGLADAIG